MKLEIGSKTGKTYSKTLDAGEAKFLLNKRLGDKISLDSIGMQGYEAEIRGGSDKDGFPMRKSIIGTKRKRALLIGGVGYRKPENGQKLRKSVRGNQIESDINQLNLKIVKNGKTPLEEIFKAEEKKEEQ